MTNVVEYRSYEITQQNGHFVARTQEGEDPSIVSRHARRVMDAIDQLWDALEQGAMPAWFTAWLKAPIDNLDLDSTENEVYFMEEVKGAGFTGAVMREKVEAFLSVLKPVLSPSSFDMESAPSEVDPPCASACRFVLTLMTGPVVTASPA
jgi:hypothetical protein